MTWPLSHSNKGRAVVRAKALGLVGGSMFFHPRQSPPASLTHDQLAHFLPADVTARLMQQCHRYPSLDALSGAREEDLVREPEGPGGAGEGHEPAGQGGCRTWWSRKVPMHGMPPRWSTTAGM